MSDYIFEEGIPEGFIPDFDIDLFHLPQHLKLQSPEGWSTFSILNQRNRTIVSVVHFNVVGDLARSPERAPYGSFIFSDNLDSSLLQGFIQYAENQLKLRGVRKIVVKNSAEAYDPLKHEELQSALRNSGFTIEREEITAVIQISKSPIDRILHKSEVKRLRKCNEAGLKFHWVDFDQLERVYNFLFTCREKKGYSLSMTLDQLQQTIALFPERFFLSVVMDKKEMVAANISVRVNQKVLYNFYHDHSEEYDHLSPVVMLNKGLYEFCQAQSISVLDLGTSQEEEEVKQSLFKFKLRLGAVPSRKLTFVKNLK